MLRVLADNFWLLVDRGGPVMWPLGVLSLVGVMLVVERAWFWVATNNPGRLRRVRQLGQMLRKGQREAAARLAAGDPSVYGRVVSILSLEPVTEAAVTDAIESQRPRIERFMPGLSTIITAAPMLGILGTVTGIISSFQVLGQQAAADPRLVGEGIAEALLTTATGLAIAIAVLFPYNAFRAQVDRTLGRIETLAAAASRSSPNGPPTISKEVPTPKAASPPGMSPGMSPGASLPDGPPGRPQDAGGP